MSWLFGAVALSIEHKNRFGKIHAAPLFTEESDDLYIACGGIEGTCRWGAFPQLNTGLRGWAVLGTGIRLEGDHCTFLSSDDWQNLLSVPKPDLSQLNGHFAIVRWDANKVEVWTDEIGLRTLYVAPTEFGYCFSSRLDWIAQATGNSEIAFDELGAQWLLTNKLTYGCLLKNVVRVGPGGYASISPASFVSHHTPWLPVIAETTEHALLETLSSFLSPTLHEGTTLSLGLSGGFDCRVVLSLLVAKNQPFVAHSFGSDADPDIATAKRIANMFSIPLHQFESGLPSVDATIALIRKYAAQTCLISPVSSVLKLRYYDAMHRGGMLLIDGAFGEVSRRQLGNRMLSRGVAVLRSGNPALLFPLLRLGRSKIFQPEMENLMHRAVMLEIESVWHEMPDVADIGAENFVDLFSLHTRAANSCPGPQDWIDSRIVNYMPYLQPSFLREVFHAPLQERRNAKLHRRAIRAHCPALASLPLVKDGVTYPFSLGTIPSWLWRRGMGMLGKEYHEPYIHQLLSHLKVFVLDTAHSRATKEFAPYAHDDIVALVRAYYGGRSDLASQVDWWLTFELWRRSLRAEA